jgi:surfactin synthase thioesterase subunit
MDIIAYDYSGYGESEGKPSEKIIYQDIEHVAEFMNKCLEIDFRNVILFGNSLGSAVSIHIATNIKYKNLKAIILLSPIASGLKIVNHKINISNEDLEEVDFFSNISKIKEVSCPIFLIHGQRDELIPYQQVLQMSKSIKKLYNWFPKSGDHNNIMSKHRVKFFSKCRMFFDYLKIFFNSSDLSPFSVRSDKLSNQGSILKFKESCLETSDGSESYKPNVFLSNNNDNITCCAESNNLFFDYKNGDEESCCKDFEGIKLRNSSNLFFDEKEKKSICGNLNNISEMENVFNVFQNSMKP